MTFIPQIITLLIICLIIISVFYLLSKIRIKKLGYWLLGGYMAVLLLSVIVYLFISTDWSPTESELVDEEVKIDLLHEVAYSGESVQEYEQYKKESWAFDVAGLGQLNVYNEEMLDYSIPIVIETISNETNLKAEFYEVDPIVGMEATNKQTASVKLTMESDKLIIALPEPSYYEYAQVAKDFPFTQFGNSVPQRRFHDSIYSGSQMIYLKVPENLELQFDPDIYYESID